MSASIKTATEIRHGRGYDARLRHIRDSRCSHAVAATQVDAWLDFLAAKGLRAGSLLAYEKRISPLIRANPNFDLADFSETELVAALNSVPEGSRRPTITAMNSLFRWARRRRLIDHDPTENLAELRRPAQKFTETFTEAEVAALTGLPGEDGLRMLLMFDTGLRNNELCQLRVRDVQLERGQLIVLDGKGGKDRVIPLTARLSAAFAEWSLLEGVDPDDFVFGHYKPGDQGGGRISHRALPLSPDGLRKWFYKRCDLVGARRLRPHATRHTFATTLLRRDANVAKVAKLLGHASVDTTTQTYAHLVTEDLRGVMELLEV